MKVFKSLFTLLFLFLLNCFPYVYYNQNQVLIKGVDIDQTLDIAIVELNKGGFGSPLTVWVIRDQIISKENASRISKIYFDYINNLDEFNTWHFAWAISNFYRNGNEEIKKELESAYLDAKKRPESLKKYKKIANEHINGNKIYMGNIHGLGKSYAKNHIVVPGNKYYIQSYDEYIKKNSKNNK